MGPELKKWLKRQVTEEAQQILDDLQESRQLHKEYAKRNRGEDGYPPGIWYQEQQIEHGIRRKENELAFLARVINELVTQDPQFQDVLHCPHCGTITNLHYKGRECIGCDSCLASDQH